MDGLAQGDWAMVSLGLHNMNGALEEEYRLPINTRDWETQEDGYIVWDCPHCTTKEKRISNEDEDEEQITYVDVPTRSKKSDIIIFEETNDLVLSLLSGKEDRKMWICPKCKAINSVDMVEATFMKYPQPHYRGCIYEEPQLPLTGLMRRRGSFPNRMRVWAKCYSMELEHKLALYRLEYIAQHGNDMEFSYQDKGDN